MAIGALCFMKPVFRKGGAEMPSQLLFTNVPYNCSERELREWIESRGIATRSIRIILDLVSGVSPAFAYADLKDDAQVQEAVSLLDGKRIRNQTVTVSQAPTRHPVDSVRASRANL